MKELNPSCLSFVLMMQFVFFICVNSLYAQRQFEVAANPKAEYEIPYELPTVEGITEVITRVLNYFETMTPYQVIDVKTSKVITDFSQINPDAGVDIRTGEFNLWTYTMGVVHSGMLYAGEVTGNKAFTDYALKNYDFIFNHLPYFRRQAEKYGVQRYSFRRILDMHALDHCGAIGAALVQAYGIKKDPRYREMIDVVADYISSKQFRLEDGTLARQRPQEKSLWTDDFYMSIPFLAQMGKLTGDKKYWDDAVKQVIQLSERLFIPEKKLYDHGWNAGQHYDPNFFWSRANGWAIMAMAELLAILPENYKNRKEVMEIFCTHVQGLAETQDGSGLWHNMLDRTDTYLESSGTAMFVYAIAKGVNNGWIHPSYGSVAQAGWNGLKSMVHQNGQIEGICRGTTFASDMVYYYHRPTSVYAMHGYGPTLLAGAEMIKLLQNDEIIIEDQNETFHYKSKK